MASDLNATIEIRGGSQGGAEPWSRTTTLELSAEGFRDPEGVGRAGDEPGVLPVSTISASLLANFDRDELCALLDHVVGLRDALRG